MNFADTNWLVSVYIEPASDDLEAVKRRSVVSRFMRRQGGPLVISHPVLLEARNIFSRVTGEREPPEWRMVQEDFEGRLRVEPMNWEVLRKECNALFSKYAWRAELGTFDTAIVASAKLAGASQFLSFDTTARVLAVAEGMQVFPELDRAAKARSQRLRR